MDRNIVLGMVEKSSFVQWKKKAYWNGQQREQFPYSFDTVEINTGRGAEDNVHRDLAVYILNESIAMAWGLKISDLNEPWVRRYPDKYDASIHLLDIFYNGNLILRTRYAAVDGCRAYLPLPKTNQTTIPAQDFELIKLLNYVENHLEAHAYFDSHFKSSGFSVVE